MKTFYNLLDTLKAELEASPFVNTVTYGDIFDLDLDKFTMYPLSHFIVNSANYNGSTWGFNVSLICMDLVDKSKERNDEFFKNTNSQDVFNQQLIVINGVLDKLKRGNLNAAGYQLTGTPTVEAFVDSYADDVAGWVVTLEILVRNDYSLC